MGRYIARRLLQMIPVFFGATFLVFAMVFAVPGDPIAAMFGDKAPDPATVQAIREQYHLNDPLLLQYGYYILGLLTGDLGQSYTGRPVSELLAQAWPITIQLALVAFVFELVVGIGIGLLAGLRRGRFADSAVLFATLTVISIPVFVIGFVAQYAIGIPLGMGTVGGDPALSQLILPAFVLGSLGLAYVARLTRTSVAENLRADYVRTAIAKGLPRKQVVSKHLLRNSLIPVVTYLGTDLGNLMAGAIVTEGIFGVPGVGNLIYSALRAKESPTVVAAIALLVVIYMVASLVVDLLYAVLDPRIRYE